MLNIINSNCRYPGLKGQKGERGFKGSTGVPGDSRDGRPGNWKTLFDIETLRHNLNECKCQISIMNNNAVCSGLSTPTLFINFNNYWLGIPGRPGMTGEKGEGGRPGVPGAKGDLGDKGMHKCSVFYFQILWTFSDIKSIYLILDISIQVTSEVVVAIADQVSKVTKENVDLMEDQEWWVCYSNSWMLMHIKDSMN